MNIDSLLHEIDTLKEKVDRFRPLTIQQVQSLKTYYDIELTYNSNAIEGSTITYAETKIILLDGITIGGKTTREHLEVINHKEAIDYIDDIAKKKSKTITRSDVLGIHAIILRGIDTQSAGKYRNANVYVMQSENKKQVFPEPVLIPGLMDDFYQWIKEPGDLHPVLYAGEAHYRLVSIHPFIDGNGRTARLLMNLILIQNGYPPAIIKMAYRSKYISAIEKIQRKNNKKDFYELIIIAVKESLKVYLETLEGNIVWI